MTSDDNRQTVRALFRSIANASKEDFSNLITDDVTWWIPTSAAAMNSARLHSTEGDRAVRGRDAVTTMLFKSGFYRDRRSSPEYDPMTYEFHHVLADGDMAVSHHTLRTTTMAGDPYENNYAFVFRLEDGKIAEVWEHLDTAHSYISLGLLDARPTN